MQDKKCISKEPENGDAPGASPQLR